MEMYIRATGNISPQHTFGNQPFLENIITHTATRLQCIEPDYKDIIDAKMIRRMSRIIRMGVAAATACLQAAGINEPGAIITGTAYGCMQDTDIFLTKMVEQKEELLTPTSFIQSTHNTIGAQIGLMLKSNNYNNAFVHRGFSFESALLDGIMLLNENACSNVLVGGIDEITDTSHAILSRFGLYRRNPVASEDLYTTSSRGTIAGEGAAFFLLSNEASANDQAKLIGLHTFYNPADHNEIVQHISSFLSAHKIDVNNIDLVITGKNGDAAHDKIYDKLQDTIFHDSTLINFKHLCGEYPTAAAFAMWFAAGIIKAGHIPASLEVPGQNEKKIKNILIYNNYQHKYHSLFLISAC